MNYPSCYSQSQEKKGGRQDKAKFNDELVLFEGDQNLNTTVHSDYKLHGAQGIQRHRPKDTIEVNLKSHQLKKNLLNFI